ncbi:NADH-quinone oxidoreductase subunit A [Myxococcota bacterium]|nr:NADH-quinone oxidoreductase subunit A [Myxococcota bacterium]
MDPAWLSAAAFVAVAAVVAAAALVGARVLGVKARVDAPLKTDTYECGEEPDGAAWVRFHPRYYVVALLFVLFDVETVFILPWALNVEGLGGTAIVAMFAFAAILLLGWAYAVRKGALRWQ